MVRSRLQAAAAAALPGSVARFDILANPLLLNPGADMKKKFLLVFLFAMIPSFAFGQGLQNYQCTHGDLQRRVEIVYEAGNTVPCEVHYYKDTEAPGEREVLWRAVNESGYCENKTQEFIAKLQNLGWSCGQGAGAEPENAPQPVDEPDQQDEASNVDDTEVLLPGDETG